MFPDDEDEDEDDDNCSGSRASSLATRFSRHMQEFLLSDLTGMLCLPQSWIRNNRIEYLPCQPIAHMYDCMIPAAHPGPAICSHRNTAHVALTAAGQDGVAMNSSQVEALCAIHLGEVGDLPEHCEDHSVCHAGPKHNQRST